MKDHEPVPRQRNVSPAKIRRAVRAYWTARRAYQKVTRWNRVGDRDAAPKTVQDVLDRHWRRSRQALRVLIQARALREIVEVYTTERLEAEQSRRENAEFKQQVQELQVRAAALQACVEQRVSEIRGGVS